MRPKASAFNKLIKYLAMREHTIRELYQKLSRTFDSDEIEAALRKANELRLLPDPRQMAGRISQSLLKRGKGQRYISGYLKKKGLPSIKLDQEQELEEGRALINRHFRFEKPYNLEQKKKIFRYLNNRGFDSQIVRQVLNEK